MKNGRMLGTLEIKSADEGSRTFKGALSSSHIDLGNWFFKDIVYPGSFKRTLDHFQSKSDPYVPLIDSHDHWSVMNVFGHMLHGEERLTGKTLSYDQDTGDSFDVPEMFLDTEWKVIDGADGDRLLDRLRSKSIRKMSMGYTPVREEFITLKEHGKVRVLREVKLGEGSVVVFPMNPEAEIERVKRIIHSFDPKNLSKSDRDEIRALLESLALADKAPPTPELAPDDPKRLALEAGLEIVSKSRLATV